MIRFFGEELLAPRPTPKLEEHPVSAVHDCLFNIFAATPLYWRPFFHPKLEDSPYVVTGTPLVTYGKDQRRIQCFLLRKPEGKKLLGRPGCRWVDNIKMDLQDVGCGGVGWI